MSRIKHASPALVISIIALIAALVVPALAQVATTALTKREKRVVRTVAKFQANKQITRRAPRLRVGSASSADSANSANNATRLGGLTAGELVRGGGRARYATLQLTNPPTAQLLFDNLLSGGRFLLTCAPPGDLKIGYDNFSGVEARLWAHTAAGATEFAAVANNTGWEIPLAFGDDYAHIIIMITPGRVIRLELGFSLTSVPDCRAAATLIEN